MNKIKILFIINNLGQGGAERQFLELIKNIDKSKFDVTVCLYAINKGIFYTEIEKIENIKLFKNVLNYKFPLFKIIEAIVYIKKHVSANKYDILVTTLFMNGVLVRLAAMYRYSNRIVSTIRNSLVIYKKRHLFAEKFFIRKSILVANTLSAANSFRGMINSRFHNNVRSIYNGFNTLRFNNKNVEKNSNETILIGNVGRITYQKNQIQLLRVISNLDNDNIKTLIIGDSGDQTDILKDYIFNKPGSKKIEILDKVQDIENYYKQFDIFVLTSLWEGCPNVLFEAMLCGCFCIVSCKANTDNFIVDGENGFVYDGTDNDLKSKIEKAISIVDTAVFNNIRDNGYRYALNNFSMQTMIQQYENLFFEIYERTKSSN